MRKKKPQESTSAEAVEESKPVKKNRLAGMLEAIEKRSDPIKAHHVATEYFKAFRSDRGLPSEEEKPKNIEENPETISEEIAERQESPSLTPVETPVITPVETPVISKKRKYETFEPLDATHTSSEARVYSSMYRETISKGINTQYFGTKRLMALTGIRGDHTVRRAIDGLIAKKSIEIIDPNYGNPIGPRYKVYSPKDIFERRKEAGIEIDPQTKKIITPVMTPVATPVKLTGVTPVKTTPVTPVKTTGVEPDIPYISKNNINRDDSIKESSSESLSNKEDDYDDTFNHRVYIISVYEKYTGNKWRVGDDEFYESENLKEILPEVIEAAIIASVLRSKTKVNSLVYCKGAIEEFQENLPPGYLSHLRKEWRKAKSKEIEKEDVKTSMLSLSLPKNSYFEERWLKNYISGFPKEEQARIKRLAESFDHFMLTAGEKKEWVKNPTGTFIGLVRGEVNVPIAKQTPTFEERVEEERRIEEEEKIREQERLESERERDEQEQRKGEIEKEIREAISQLSDADLVRFITRARKKYRLKALESDESVLGRIPYLIMHELYERGEEDWRRIWGEIDKIDS